LLSSGLLSPQPVCALSVVIALGVLASTWRQSPPGFGSGLQPSGLQHSI